MFNREPAVIIAAVVVALTGLVNALVTDATLRDALVAILIAVGGLLTRAIVYAPATVARIRARL